MKQDARNRNYRATLLNLDHDVWRKIQEVAWNDDRTASSLARIFLREGIERHIAKTESNKAA